jgi:hypothetical protein
MKLHTPEIDSDGASADLRGEAGAPGIASTKLATLVGVREHSEGSAVELWLNRSGRVVVRAFNECGNNYTEVDLFDLLSWAKGPRVGEIEHGAGWIAALSFAERD